MAGQMIVDGFMQLARVGVPAPPGDHDPGADRDRLGVNTLSTLIASQVVLSLVLPFAVVPLVRLTSRRDVMGDLVNGRPCRSLAIPWRCS